MQRFEWQLEYGHDALFFTKLRPTCWHFEISRIACDFKFIQKKQFEVEILLHNSGFPNDVFTNCRKWYLRKFSKNKNSRKMLQSNNNISGLVFLATNDSFSTPNQLQSGDANYMKPQPQNLLNLSVLWFNKMSQWNFFFRSHSFNNEVELSWCGIAMLQAAVMHTACDVNSMANCILNPDLQ